jgi:hypothetical protein
MQILPRLLVFAEAYNYQVFELPFAGAPAILDMSVVDEQGRWRKVRLDTNAGYRELFCTSVKVLERSSDLHH